MKIHIGLSRTALYLGVAVFSVTTFVSSIKADIPYWPLLLHDAGYIWAEIPSIISYRGAIVDLLDIGASTLLLLLSFYVGQGCKLTRRSTVIILVSLAISALLGLLSGYAIRQTEMPEYSIFDVSMLYVVPGELSSRIVWCMLGLVAGNWRNETLKTV